MTWHKEAEKRKRAEDAADWDWAAYFESIRRVCPWSGAAYRTGAIVIQHWHSQVEELGTNQARIYLAPQHKPRQLKKITDQLNETHDLYEFLWSHPRYGHNSTPTAVIIQQSRHTLETIRKQLKNDTVYK